MKLINQDKRKERRQWIYWKEKVPSFEDIGIIKNGKVVRFTQTGESEKQKQNQKRKRPGREKLTKSSKRPPFWLNEGSGCL